jgi:ABC-type multidrug transport system fused ATPase/permease subunit
MVMEQGEIVESGSHDELIAQGGHYAKLYHKQFN